MKDYDELLKYYELYETIGTGNFYFFLRAEDDSSAIWGYSILGKLWTLSLTYIVLKFFNLL